VKDRNTIEFENGITLEARCDGKHFLGLGRVAFRGTDLRCPDLPWTVHFESESGFKFDRFELVDLQQSGSDAVIVLSSEGTWMPRLQEADAMGDSRIRTRRLRAPVATVRWCFRPITEQVWENEWTGLAMRIEVNCPGHPIHWVLEDTTWEIGGAADGCTLIQQDMTSIDMEQVVTEDNTFSTRERFFTPEDETPEALAADSLPGSFPMDMMPRGGGSSMLDFQAKGDVALALFSEKPGLTRARIEKFRSENVIHYTDRAFFEMTEHAVAPERKLLVYRHPQPLKRHEWRNLWLDAFTEVRRRVHANYDFELEIPRPTAWCFMWNFDFEVYMADWVDPLIEALPEYKRLGYADLFTHGAFEGTSNDFSIPGRNVCLNYDYKYCEEFGGPAAMKRLFDAAHEQGMRTWQWFGFYLDTRSPLAKEHPEWRLHAANGNIAGCACNMRSGFRDHMLDCLRTIREETGLDGAFWDSYQNTGVTRLDWGHDGKAPHAEEIWRFQAELQKLGVHQRCESATIFGISTIGIYGFKDDPNAWHIRRRWWNTTVENDDVFAWLDTAPAFFTGGNFTDGTFFGPKDYFWLLGHRAVPTLSAFPWGPTHKDKPVPSGGPSLPGGERAEEIGQINRLYNAALPHMHRLRVTEGGRYSLWLDENNQPSVIWAFQDAEMEYTGSVTDLATDEQSQADGTLKLEAGHVYKLQ